MIHLACFSGNNEAKLIILAGSITVDGVFSTLRLAAWLAQHILYILQRQHLEIRSARADISYKFGAFL